MRYYVHGAGRPGAQAWPRQALDLAIFADHSTAVSAREKAKLVGRQAPAGTYDVVAHSLGAVAVALAMRDQTLRPTRLVLVEPALYDVARGEPAIERHIEPMTRARARAAAGDLFGYWQIVKPMMFGGEATTAAWDNEHELAARMAILEPPWGHDVDPSLARSVPTLVLTGGWNEEYEAIAGILARTGADHAVLEGHDHRVQDHPDFDPIVEHFLRSAG